MSTTITIATVEYETLLVDGYTARRPSRNVSHPILSSEDAAVTLRPAAMRTGRLRVAIADETDAATLLDALSAGAIADLDSTDRSSIDMTFFLAAGGNTSLTLDPDTRDHWWIEFDYQETTP
jgi:hypothetical protein